MILKVNDVNVTNTTHSTAVDALKMAGRKVVLVCILTLSKINFK